MKEITSESFKKDYFKAIGQQDKENLNENQRRPIYAVETMVEMYNDLVRELEEAKELVYQLTKERLKQ